MNRLLNKVAIVTGASLGIGKAIARQFTKEGAHVIVADLLEDEGKAAVQEIREAGGSADFFRLDVTDSSVVEKTFKAVRKKCGCIDVLVGAPDLPAYHAAYGAVYLASDESGFVTGSELVIDGGYTAQ